MLWQVVNVCLRIVFVNEALEKVGLTIPKMPLLKKHIELFFSPLITQKSTFSMPQSNMPMTHIDKQ